MSRPVFQQVWMKRMIMRIMKRSKRSKIFSVSQWSETLYDNQHLLNYIFKLELNIWILIDDVPESIQIKPNTRLPDFFPYFSLEIQMDENEALKAALQSTLKAKEEDLRLFGEMMEETKTVFLQALRQYKQNAQGT